MGEFSKEATIMQETKRMANEANRMGQQAQERMQSGLEAASRSFMEANKGFQALAAEMTEIFQGSVRRCHPHLGETHRCEVARASNANPVGLR